MREISTSERRIQFTTPAQSLSKPINTEANPGGTAPALAFSEKALPLHVNLTHTPPKLHEDDDSESVNDPGHIGTLTLLPCAFPDGSNGWKGRRKVDVELLNVQLGERAPVVDVTLFVSAKVVNNNVVAAPNSRHVAEVDGGAEGYESDNDDSSLMP